MEKATEAAKHLDLAYRYLAVVAVNGDNVDRLAAARQEMRAAYALLTEEKKEGNDG